MDLEWTTGPALAALVGLVLCVVSVFAALALTRPRMLHASSPESSYYDIGASSSDRDDSGSYSSGTAARTSHDSSILARKSFSSGLLANRDSPTPYPIAAIAKALNASQASSAATQKSILQLGASFWIVCLLAILLYGSVMPFINITQTCLSHHPVIQSKWYPGDLQTAGALMSLPDLLCAILTPLFGLIADKLGGQPTRLLPLSGVLLAIAHSLLFFTSLPPAPSLVLLGIGTATFLATLWPTVSMLVPDALLGTAIGAVQVAVNAALAACR
ncbi:hypothetical protein BCR44DRAFT_1515571 [Catenaria anguillulae PL171]|uniref:Lysosomal dipeptide transporter MFSD1 n=1 Tax=Catenaria anguillulae PL171 TaxID=765915 RepID=A0A1Y2HET3_9FUNG|nr:hypothetical protein BCR44DRAFT_1515571 [Catenaria anguillulae PL171]